MSRSIRHRRGCPTHLRGSRMAFMQEKDAPQTMPASGQITALNTASKDASVYSTQKQSEDRKILRHILVVEDDASLATLEADVLTARGYTVEVAGSGELAVAALHQ